MISPDVRLHRRTLLGAAAAAPAAIALAACSDDEPATASGPPDKVTYTTNFGQLGRDAYAYVALDKGFFAEANLDVTIEPGAGTNPNLVALLSGRAQFTVIDMAGAIISHGNTVEDREGGSAEAEGYAALAAIQQLPLAAVMAYDDSGIASVHDLPGRRVGFPAGAVTELLFPAYVQIAGVDLGEVELVSLDPPQLVPALAAGRVDAIGQFVVGESLVAAAGDGREVVVLPYSEYVTDLYGVTLFTTTALAEQEPDLCVRFRTALLRGLEYAMANPSEAGQILAEHNPEADPEVAASEVAAMIPYAQVLEPNRQLGDLDEVRMVLSLGIMQGAGLSRPGMHPDDLVAWELTLRPDQD
jgi:NitT/TauT family transport system substrate-binding protein